MSSADIQAKLEAKFGPRGDGTMGRMSSKLKRTDRPSRAEALKQQQQQQQQDQQQDQQAGPDGEFAPPPPVDRKTARKMEKDRKKLGKNSVSKSDLDSEDSSAQEEGSKTLSSIPSTSGLPKYLRIGLLLSFIPIIFSVPYVLNYAGEKVKGNRKLLYGAWAIYTAILLSIFFHFKKKTVTLNSFVTQLMLWMIGTLGVYHLVDLPRMVNIYLRQDVLYVWCTFTMIFNIVYFFLDTTDHKSEEERERRKEERKQKRDEEKRQKEAEKRKKKLDDMMDPKTRRLANLGIYLFLGCCALYVLYYTYNYYLFLQEELAMQNSAAQPRDFTAEDKITDPDPEPATSESHPQ